MNACVIPPLTPPEQALLTKKRVAVIGCGGLGGYLTEFLARIGIGSIRCVDGDVFEESNLNRQLLSSLDNLGQNKAEAAAKRVQAITAKTQAQAYPVFLDEANARRLIAGCDAVLDGLDNIPARRLLAKVCAEEKIPYVYGAISGWTAQAALCLPGEDLVNKLYPEDVSPIKGGVLSFTPALCAAMQVSLCVKLLMGRPVQTGVLHHCDLLWEDYEKIHIQP